MQFRAQSDDNRKLQTNWSRIDRYVARYKAHTSFEISVTRRVKKPSSPQRKYYFGVVLPCLLKAYWYEPEDANVVHKHNKITYFHVQPDKHGIYLEKTIPSVFSDKSAVSPEDRKGFIDWVIRKCTDERCDNPQYVPDPNE